MNFLRNYILPIMGLGYEWHLHRLSTELSKQHHDESQQTTKLIASTELITNTLSSKLETYRDACEEKLKKYSNYLLMTSIIIGVLGQILPFVLPDHNLYIIGTQIPLINIYYFVLTNTFGCLIICFINCIIILNDISFFMTEFNHLWSNIETLCITTLNTHEANKFELIQNLLSDNYYIQIYNNQIYDLETCFNYNCYILHHSIIVSAIIGFICFILSFILSLEAILIPIDIVGPSHSYTSFIIVLVIISIELSGLILYIIIHRTYTTHSFIWYSGRTGIVIQFNHPITVQIH